MEESSCTNLAKCLLMFTGVCYLVSAGGLSYVGIWAFSTYDHFDEVADTTITLLPAGIILGVSAFMCIIGILAFVAAFRSNKILLAVFFCLILLVFIGEVLASILGFVYRNKVEGVLDGDLMNAVNNYNVKAYKEQIDYLQREGCLDKLNDEFSKNLIYLTGTAIFLVVVQFLALTSTCILMCRTKEEHQYHSLIEEIGGGLRV